MTLTEFMRQYISVVSQVASLVVLSGIFFIFVFALSLLLLRVWVRWRAQGLLPHLRQGETTHTVAFFHPYCNAGGGGERVLWTAIRAIQIRYPTVQCVVYTGDVDATPTEILVRAQQRFNISLPRQVEFVYLKRRGWVEASKYPYFTLLGQSLGSVVLGWEAMLAFVPDLYVDTMGFAFTLPLFKLFAGCAVACYVHYPTISTDMLERVSRRSAAHNNMAVIANSFVLSNLKLIYYRLFAYLYGVVGKRAQVIMVNSTWTHEHIVGLWRAPRRTHIVYPPCDVSQFVTIPLSAVDQVTERNIISVGQFRPEKDHALMIRAFKLFLDGVKDRSPYRLLLVGGCRNEDDSQRVQGLRSLAEDLGVGGSVVFHLNVPFARLSELLSISTIGLHTMWKEHFGICVVEYMAAGPIALAHDSGGPRMDIVVPHNGQPTGYLAATETQYAKRMADIFDLSPAERLKVRQNARQSVQRFSEHDFELAFMAAMAPFFNTKFGLVDGQENGQGDGQ